MGNELPALPLFSADFLVAVASWPPDRVGAYWLAILYQWEHGGVPADDTTALALLLHTTSRAAAKRLWAAIAAKFERGPDGQYRNRRLEDERARARAKVASLAARGARGAARRWDGQSNGQSIAQAVLEPIAEASPRQCPSNGIQIQSTYNPPLPPPAVAGGRLTRTERAWAKTVRRTHGGCPHEPACGDDYTCVGRLVGEKRAAEWDGLGGVR